jgi:hypothetical protein
MLFKVLFAVLFVAIRTIYWPIVSCGFWSDCLFALRSPKARVHSMAAYLFLLLSNIGLTGLQFVWTREIYAAVADTLA